MLQDWGTNLAVIWIIICISQYRPNAFKLQPLSVHPKTIATHEPSSTLALGVIVISITTGTSINKYLHKIHHWCLQEGHNLNTSLHIVLLHDESSTFGK